MRHAVLLLVFATACGAPARGTRDFENWCYIEKHHGNSPSECADFFAQEKARKDRERAAALAKQAENRRRWEEFAQRNPYGACMVLAQTRYKQCTAAVEEAMDEAYAQAQRAQRQRDAAAMMLAQPRRRYATPTGQALGGTADAINHMAAAKLLEQSTQGRTAPPAGGYEACAADYNVEATTCAAQYQEPETATPQPPEP